MHAEDERFGAGRTRSRCNVSSAAMLISRAEFPHASSLTLWQSSMAVRVAPIAYNLAFPLRVMSPDPAFWVSAQIE